MKLSDKKRLTRLLHENRQKNQHKCKISISNNISFLTRCGKCPNTEFFSGPYFPTFGLNTERYGVPLRIQSKCGKIWTRKNSVFGHFSRNVCYVKLRFCMPAVGGE